jgi:hypothetical protein
MFTRVYATRSVGVTELTGRCEKRVSVTGCNPVPIEIRHAAPHTIGYTLHTFHTLIRGSQDGTPSPLNITSTYFLRRLSGSDKFAPFSVLFAYDGVRNAHTKLSPPLYNSCICKIRSGALLRLEPRSSLCDPSGIVDRYSPQFPTFNEWNAVSHPTLMCRKLYVCSLAVVGSTLLCGGPES